MRGSRITDLPVKHGARELALRLTRRAAEAALRLHDPEDVEALHDFRVSVRRIRSLIRAYDSYLELGAKVTRGLRKLARRTNGPRDAEVGLEWLSGLSGFSGRQRVGMTWLIDGLEQEKSAAYETVRRKIPLCWMREEARLRRRLARPFADDVAAGTLGQVGGRVIQAACDGLEDRLRQIDTVEDEAPIHRARIQGKRLRYLLEPFKLEVPEAGQALKELRRFQDLLGDLNDTYVMLGRLRRTAGVAAADRAGRLFELTLDETVELHELRAARQRSELPGLLEAARRARARQLELFQRLRERYLGGGAESALAHARRAAERLAAGAERPGLQVVRGHDQSEPRES